MAFYNLPVFNILADFSVYDGVTRTVVLSSIPCQLQNNWKRGQTVVQVLDPVFGEPFDSYGSLVKVPAGTNVFLPNYTNGYIATYLEVPAGSGRLYEIIQVDDCAKGFSNEYRVCLVGAVWFEWPVPTP